MTGAGDGSSLTRRETVAGAIGLIAAGLPAPAPAATSHFEIAGAKLRWGGAPVRLLGVAVGDPIYIRKDRPASDYAVIAEVWRANVVRISLHPGHWRADRDAALRALAADIGAARRAGLFVILDWHVIGFPDRYASQPDPSWGLPQDAYDPDLALAVEFWTEMAKNFGRDPAVLFELWNEPVVDPKLWVSTGQHWPLLKATWLRLIEAIRGYSDNLVLAAGGRWAHDLKGVAADPIPDERVAYTWHCYPPEDKGLPGRWFDTLDGLQKQHAVVVTEWGFCRTCDHDIRGTPEDFGIPFVRNVLEGLDLHSTAWCWSAGAEPALLGPDWVSTTEYGRFVRNYLETARRPAAAATARPG